MLKDTYIIVVMSQEEKREFRQNCKSNGTTPSQVLRMFIREYNDARKHKAIG